MSLRQMLYDFGYSLADTDKWFDDRDEARYMAEEPNKSTEPENEEDEIPLPTPAL